MMMSAATARCPLAAHGSDFRRTVRSLPLGRCAIVPRSVPRRWRWWPASRRRCMAFSARHVADFAANWPSCPCRLAVAVQCGSPAVHSRFSAIFYTATTLGFGPFDPYAPGYQPLLMLAAPRCSACCSGGWARTPG